MTTSNAPTRRGWSLLELLVALALLLGIGALVVPAFTGFGERAAMQSARESVAAAVLTARSEAQRRGAPMELVVDRERLLMRPVRSEGEEGPPGEVVAELPGGVSLGSATGRERSGVGDEVGSEQPAQTVASPIERLGIFWPNGSVEVGALELDGAGESARGKVSSWTGAVIWSDAAEPAAEAPAE